MRIIIACSMLVVLGAGGCANTPDPATQAKPGQTKVVVAFYPLGWLAQSLGGDNVHVTNLTPPGAEPHDLELTPQDLRAIREADVVLYLGRGFQPSLEAALEGSDAIKVDALATPGLDLAKPAESGGELGVDPHVWLDPLRLTRIADVVAEALNADPSEVDATLAQLDADFTRGLASCRRTDVFTSHAAFGYLADRYGLNQVAITGLSPEAEPRPRDLERVADQARAAGATTIFFETLISPKLAEQVADEIGAKAAVLDPLEGLAKERVANGDDYVSVQRENLAALRNALDCVSPPKE